MSSLCVVTGAAGPAGFAISAALQASGRSVRALDSPEAIAARTVETGAEVQAYDLTDPALVEQFRGAEAVVHVFAHDMLASVLSRDVAARRHHAVTAAQTVATAAAAAGVRQLVIVTSALVHGVNETPATDGEPTAHDADPGLVGDLIEVDQVAAQAARVHPGLRVTRLLPAALVGPGVDSFVSRYFRAPRLLAIREAEMRWQFCHVDDLAAAVVTVLTEELSGACVLGSAGSLDLATVENLSGVGRIELPQALALSTAEQLHRVGILPLAVDDLAFVVRPWLVEPGVLIEHGWQAPESNADCLVELAAEAATARLGARRLTRKDAAALGVAGAAVAAVATAAVWRNARGGRK